jgi:hypothetical protein
LATLFRPNPNSFISKLFEARRSPLLQAAAVGRTAIVSYLQLRTSPLQVLLLTDIYLAGSIPTYLREGGDCERFLPNRGDWG